ncbi:MAG: undecaprenyl-diphosphate phosphatase [Acidobacteriota bacterium]
MSWVQAIVLGVVQGLTEFLPVSSSAHLILAPRLLGWPDQGLDADLAAHLGTFLAVAVYFRRDLVEIVSGGLDALRGDRPRGRLAWILIVGTVPLAIGGLLLAHWAETAARDPRIIIGSSIGFGLLLAVADLWGRRQRELHGVTTADGLWVGAAQVLAAIPGTSRSGITITAGLFRGLDRASAARFSFLLAVPAMLLVAAKHVLDVALGKVPLGALGPQALLFAVSAVVGFLVIAWLLRYLQRGSLMGFVIYRIVLGLVVLALWWRGGL